MVSFWPWRGDASSTASFEKTLSTLSTKITESQSRLDRARSSSRRVKVLWTLYLTFTYLVYAVVVLLVVGYKKMGPYEWTGLTGGPVVIYSTRTLLSAYFNLRIESLASRLKDQQQERTKTIQKLKNATKYDSTMELIEKYGGAEGKPMKGKEKGPEGEQEPGDKGSEGTRSKHAKPPMAGRTNMPPPPTANIQRRPDPRLPPPNSLEPTAEFAPNAEDAHQPPGPLAIAPQAYVGDQSHLQHHETRWYDRLFDVILGEDETAPKNRIVLLCASCRLVNGQAPPGVKSLAELGRWRCMSCGGENGVDDDEGKRIVREVLQDQVSTLKEEVGPETDDLTTDDDDGLTSSSGKQQERDKRKGEAKQ